MDAFDDSRLLQFDTYEDYLDSYVTKQDIQNLCSTVTARKMAEWGFRANTEVYTREIFEDRKQYAYENMYPIQKTHILYSANLVIGDAVLKEIASRERANRVGIFSTIIFIRQRTHTNFEISGYIDFKESLKKSRINEEHSVDWVEVFSGRRRLWPSPRDLGFYNWRTGYSNCKNSDNYKVISDPHLGLLFINRHDRQVIYSNPSKEHLSENTTRTEYSSEKYEYVVLFDHINRKKF